MQQIINVREKNVNLYAIRHHWSMPSWTSSIESGQSLRSNDATNVKKRNGETPLAYIDILKKVLDEIKGLSDDTILGCFVVKFKLYTLTI